MTVKTLKKIGIDKNDKFVCIHNRSNCYRNEPFNSVRNSSIENFEKGIKFLLDNNIKVIAWAGMKKNKFDLKSKNFFDYSSSNFQNDFRLLFDFKMSIFYWSTVRTN